MAAFAAQKYTKTLNHVRICLSFPLRSVDVSRCGPILYMILSIYFFIRVASVEDSPTPFFAKFRKKEKKRLQRVALQPLGENGEM
jgi:hypothetical protein